MGLKSVGPKKYYVKKRYPESIEHSLLVGLIVEEIKKHTEDVKTYQTHKPDIIFKNKAGQEIALEVETGKSLNKNRKWSDEKFLKVKKKYGKRMYIILTDKDKRNSYIRYQIPILLRKDIIQFVRLQFSGQKNSVLWDALSRKNNTILRLEDS